MKIVKWSSILIGSLILLLSFQNCGKNGGFGISDATEELSSLCVSKIQSSLKLLSGSSVSCDAAADYACERRIFSPDIANGFQKTTECESEHECVIVDVRRFNTASARQAEVDESSFAPGGEYNREEVHCFHQAKSRGIALFHGEGANLSEALGHSVEACRQAQENGR